MTDRLVTAPSPAPAKSPFQAAVPVALGIVGGAFAMTAAFAMSAVGREAPAPQNVGPAKPAIAAHAHLSPAKAETAALNLIAFNHPLPGYAVNSPFGLRKMPWEEGGRLHAGVDIAAPAGAPVRATLDGVVTKAGFSFSYGRFVEVAHANGLVSFYAHLGGTPKGVKAGLRVVSGQVIGYVGGSGRSTGSHLHFEIRLAGKPLNPTAFLGRSFASADQLPLSAAARYSGKVRIAQVARWPTSVQPKAQPAVLISGKPDPRVDGKPATITQVAAIDGRVRAVIQIKPTPVEPTKFRADDGSAPGDLPFARSAPKREAVDLDKVLREAAEKPKAETTQ